MLTSPSFVGVEIGALPVDVVEFGTSRFLDLGRECGADRVGLKPEGGLPLHTMGSLHIFATVASLSCLADFADPSWVVVGQPWLALLVVAGAGYLHLRGLVGPLWPQPLED